jgi:hypothetical protein
VYGAQLGDYADIGLRLYERPKVVPAMARGQIPERIRARSAYPSAAASGSFGRDGLRHPAGAIRMRENVRVATLHADLVDMVRLYVGQDERAGVVLELLTVVEADVIEIPAIM